ncbi:hypothetical protein [uncultured Hymenobacter sp.]|uniref:hypothetical protein n=1 Tax=uncultured Hymenobacter sp. TaxID=170016 RepID=UPI0035CAF5DF
MRRSSPFAALAYLLGLAALLAGCCANNTCDCDDQLEDAIQLQFRVGDPALDPSSFRPEEVDTVRLVRYRLPPKKDPPATPVPPAPIVPDTVVLARPTARQANDIITISNTAPFPISGSLRVNAYRYAILLTNGRRQTSRLRVRQRYDVSSITLDGGYQADGCCTCYENRQKQAYLRISAPGSSQPTRSDSAFYNLKQASSQLIELTRPR